MRSLTRPLFRIGDAAMRRWQGMRLYEFPTAHVEVHYDLPKLGLFAHLTLIAALATRRGEQNRAFTVRCFNDSYRGVHREDWFSHLFVDRSPSPLPATVVRLSRTTRTPMRWRGRRLTLAEAGRWFTAKYAVQPRLQSRVDAFAAEHFGPGRVLGVHYRGTDKIAEAPRADYERVLDHIRAKADRGVFDRIFVATDETGFATFIRNHAPLPVVLMNDALRSRAGAALHVDGGGHGFRKAEEALIDCLLLARSRALVKTASALSGWSVVFNPQMEVDFINPPPAATCSFPDCEILRL